MPKPPPAIPTPHCHRRGCPTRPARQPGRSRRVPRRARQDPLPVEVPGHRPQRPQGRPSPALPLVRGGSLAELPGRVPTSRSEATSGTTKRPSASQRREPRESLPHHQCRMIDPVGRALPVRPTREECLWTNLRPPPPPPHLDARLGHPSSPSPAKAGHPRCASRRRGPGRRVLSRAAARGRADPGRPAGADQAVRGAAERGSPHCGHVVGGGDAPAARVAARTASGDRRSGEAVRQVTAAGRGHRDRAQTRSSRSTPARRRSSASIDDEDPPTLLVDEADTIFGTVKAAEKNEEVRGLLNAGHQRNRPTLRVTGPEHKPTDVPHVRHGGACRDR